MVWELRDPCGVNWRENVTGGGFYEVSKSELGHGSMHSKGLGMVHASPLHSCDLAPLVSYLSAMISHYTGSHEKTGARRY